MIKVINDNILENEEKIIFKLRNLYQSYGYFQYKMSKFEDYDFYSKNKDFLISDNIITFTDTNGKLMALKPDVTLSIIRNIKEVPKLTQKLYYNENVYRVSKSSNSFRELMQMGLECIGDIDDYSIFEVVLLAIKSLKTISKNSILSISHLGILSDILKNLDLSKEQHKLLSKCIEDKNSHELTKFCDTIGIDQRNTSLLKSLLLIHDKPKFALLKLKDLEISPDHIKQLEDILSFIELYKLTDMVRIDLSLINDFNYYNGIVFRGFVKDVPNTVLSGGQYDKLMQKMKKQSFAIGFAIYLDTLDRFLDEGKKYDVETLILYNKESDLPTLTELIKQFNNEGRSFMVQKTPPSHILYKEVIKIDKNEVIQIEKNA